ncbi:MAG TPA: GNAT family N-acetyltransferase [Bryobacteraceae bacterium]|nr:GNAT family N-acetyltransferase [Bryobacteraceae bacterium]
MRSFAELARLREAWDRLATARRTPEVFHTFAWAEAWWRGHGRRFEVFSPVVRDADGEVVAIWPLVLAGREIRALGDGASDHNDLLASSEYAEPALRAALGALAASRRDWDTGVIEWVSDRGNLLGAANHISGVSKVCLEVFPAGKGWAAVAEEGPKFFLDLARKESLRRHRKKLEQLGQVTFRHIEDVEEIKVHMQIFQRQHIARWALKGIRSSFLDVSTKDYYSALPVCLSPSGPLRFAVLEVDRRPVAYHLGFELAGRYVWYKPTFDVDLAELGPGEVLLQSVMQYCAGAGIRELDFTVGDEAYKRRFCNLSYEYYRIHLFASRSAKRYVLLGRELAKRRCPALYTRIRSQSLYWTGRLRRLRQVIRRDGVLRFCRRRIRQLLRACVFRRDEVLIFRVSKDAGVLPDLVVPELEVLPFRLSLLAEASLEHQSYLSADRLESFRRRIAAGDRAVVAICRGKLAHVAWVGRRNTIIAATETGPRCALDLSEEASVIYDCWTPEEFRGMGIYPAVLQSLLRQELHSGRDVWIYCTRENQASRAGIRKAGFVEAARFIRTVVFGRLERCRVVRYNRGETRS